MINLLFPEDNYIFDTHTPIQKEYIRRIHADGTEKALEWLSAVKQETEQTYPRTLKFCWSGDSSASYRFELSENRDFSGAFCAVTADTYTVIGNLKIGTTYYWRVNGCTARRFQTASECPRFIRIEGALNVRDLGGNRIKQGILYRGSAIDEPFLISEAGKKTFREELKIVTQLDLRKTARDACDTQSIVPGVKRLYAPYRPYMEVFEAEHRTGIRRIMGILADAANYPVYFHCMGGADRTGMIALFLRAIAGESDDDIHTDYELTALSTYAAGAAEGAHGFRSRNSTYYRQFLEELQQYAPGEPVCAYATNFLLSCGVTPEEIERIRENITK